MGTSEECKVDLDETEKYREQVLNIENRANLIRDIHAHQAIKYKKRFTSYSLIILMSSALVSILSIADPEILYLDDSTVSVFRTITAILGLIILLLSLADKIYGINEKASRNEHAVKLLTDFIRKCHRFRNVEISTCSSEKEISLSMDTLETQYSQINHMLPFSSLSEKEFLESRQRHYIKSDISKKLKEDPYENVGKLLNDGYLNKLRNYFKI